jgi:hypothetical protein
MPAAILIISIGAVMVYSALKGIGITDVLAGVAGDSLDPHGSAGTVTGAAVGDSLTDPAASSTDTSQYNFQGPNAVLLGSLATAAVKDFNLKITSLATGGHVANSYHYRHRAFDAAGAAADMAAYWQWAHDTYGHTLAELFYDPKGAVKDGNDIPAIGGHSDHVHTAA